MPRRFKLLLLLLFAGTGFSALTLQVVWQRVISLHAGVDLFSITTVVSAFLAGLGLGSLLGGALADRLGPRRSLLAFAASNAVIGVFAWFSIWLFYDLYRSSVAAVDGVLSAFAFNFGLLIVPTTLMGLSLPLVARGLVERIDEAAPMVGRLYAVNTIGAGVGAGVSGWLLLGNLGFLGTVRLAGLLNLSAAILILTLWKTTSRRSAQPVAPAAASRQPAAGRPWRWLGLYGLTGAVALGMELVFFRIIDALMRTNSYTFGHLLSLYLLLFGAGAAVASRLVRRTTRPARWFLGLQYGVGIAALTGLLLLIEVPARLGLSGPFDRHFAIGGYNSGGYRLDSTDELIRLGMVNLFGPLLIMGAPVVLMGMSFPFMQALVSERVETLGRRTGLLLFANVVGNVTGILLVGFVLLDRLGTSGSLRLLAGLLVLPGLGAAALAATRVRRVQLSVVAVGLLGAVLAVFPSNSQLWAYLHGTAEGENGFALAEDRACVTALKQVGTDDLLYVNAASQNGYPFDDFHVLIGLVPTLIHQAPNHVLAVGLGIGATPYGMSRDRRVEHLDVVEICGGAVRLQGTLAARGAAESERLLDDQRVDLRVGDGRKFLLRAKEPFDVVTVDAVRPQSAFSGSLYSVQFFELVRSRLGAGGIVSGWIPTARVQNSITQAFPHVVRFTVASYHGAQFFLASERPIVFDRSTLLDRFRSLEPDRWFSPSQTESIQDFLAVVEPVVVRDGRLPAVVGDADLNHDLMPRDEYFLNNPAQAPASG